MRPLKPIQPIAAVLDDAHLPEPVRPLAQAWRDLDELEDDALTSWREARGKVEAARAADRRAALEAAEKGRPAPVPTDAHEAQALADVDAHAARLGNVRERKRAAGRDLLAALVEHRGELEVMAADRVTQAAEDYAGVLDKAHQAVTQAAEALSIATESMGVLGELDRDARLRHEVGTPAWPVAAVDMSATRRHLSRIREAAASLTRKA